MKAGVAEEEAEAGYRIKNKNPTQRCGEQTKNIYDYKSKLPGQVCEVLRDVVPVGYHVKAPHAARSDSPCHGAGLLGVWGNPAKFRGGTICWECIFPPAFAIAVFTPPPMFVGLLVLPCVCESAGREEPKGGCCCCPLAVSAPASKE